MGMLSKKCDGIQSGKDDRGRRIELANTYFFKGRKSLSKGNKDEALRMFRASVAIQEEVYGIYHKRTARSYFFLAQTLFKHTNEFDKALTAFRRALRVGLLLDQHYNFVEGSKQSIKELLLEKKLVDENSVQSFFSSISESVRFEKEGLDCTERNDYESALEAFGKCLVIEEKAEGTFPLDRGHIYIRIAEVNRKEGEHAMAANAYRSALSIFESALGEEHVDSIRCIKGIESSLYELNLNDSSIEEYTKKILTSLRHCQKGDTLMESKMFQEALSEYEAARSIEEQSLGKYPLTASNIRKKLGMAFRSLKKCDQAILELRTTLSINIFECGENHESVMATLHDIRSVMREEGYDFSSVNKYINTVSFSVKHERYGEHLLLEKKDFSGAIEEFQKSLALEVSALGKYHLTQGELFKAIGDAFFLNSIFDFAVVNYRHALLVYIPSLGMEHSCTMVVLTLIGDAARETGLNANKVDEYRKAVSESIAIQTTAENLIVGGKYDEVIAAYRRAVGKEGSLLGDRHLSTADLHGKIAKVLKNIERYDSAIVEYRTIFAINLKSLGISHINTQKALEELVDVAILKGLKREDAIRYGQNAKISIENEDNGDKAMINGKFQSAIINYKKALEIEKEILGDDHLVSESLIRKIVECLKSSGKSDQSFQFYRKLIRMYMSYEPPDYDANDMICSIETTAHDLGLSEDQTVEYIGIVKESVKCEINGDSAEESKNYVKAIDHYSRCLLMEESLFGMLHPSTWPLHKKIGSTLGKKGDFDLAIISHSKALTILESYLGMKEQEAIETYNDLLNAAQKKISSTSNINYPNSQNEDKRGASDIFAAFASLRKGVSIEGGKGIGDKTKILMGLSQRWHELDEIKASIEINSEEHIERENLVSTPDSSQGEKRKPSDARVVFDKQVGNEILQNPNSLNVIPPFTSSTIYRINSFEGDIALTPHFDSENITEPTSIRRQDDKNVKKTLDANNHLPKAQNLENVKTGKINEDSRESNISREREIESSLIDVLQSPGHRDAKPKLSMYIPEIPAFNANRNIHCNKKDDYDDLLSSSDSSSESSYESL